MRIRLLYTAHNVAACAWTVTDVIIVAGGEYLSYRGADDVALLPFRVCVVG